MNFLNPPTDTLAKFLTIGGLASFLFFSYFSFNKSTTLDEGRIALRSEQEALESKIKRIQTRLEPLQAELLEHCKNGLFVCNLEILEFQVPRTSGKFSGISSSQKEAFELLDAFTQLREELIVSQSTLKRNERLQAYRESVFESLFDVSIFFALFSVLIMGIGLLFWLRAEVQVDYLRRQDVVRNGFRSNRCESCGVLLRTDRNLPELQSNCSQFYCTYCFDYAANTFKEPDLTLPALKDRLRLEMMAQGLGTLRIRFYLSWLESQARWQKVFRRKPLDRDPDVA